MTTREEEIRQSNPYLSGEDVDADITFKMAKDAYTAGADFADSHPDYDRIFKALQKTFPRFNVVWIESLTQSMIENWNKND